MANREASRYCNECGSTRARSEKYAGTCIRCTGEDQVVTPRFASLRGIYDSRDVELPPGQGGVETEAWHRRRAKESQAWR